MNKLIKISFIFTLLFLVRGFCYGNDKDANYQKYLSHTSTDAGANVYNLAPATSTTHLPKHVPYKEKYCN